MNNNGRQEHTKITDEQAAETEKKHMRGFLTAPFETGQNEATFRIYTQGGFDYFVREQGINLADPSDTSGMIATYETKQHGLKLRVEKIQDSDGNSMEQRYVMRRR